MNSIFILDIRNDLKAMMNRIEKGLNAYFTQNHTPEQHLPNGHGSLKLDN